MPLDKLVHHGSSIVCRPIVYDYTLQRPVGLRGYAAERLCQHPILVKSYYYYRRQSRSALCKVPVIHVFVVRSVALTPEVRQTTLKERSPDKDICCCLK